MPTAATNDALKILIADDDPVLVFALEAQLDEWGFEVVACSDGDEAYQLLSAKQGPKLALLDWSMPGRTGPQICRTVREESSADSDYIYVIMLTGRADHESLIEALDAGADDFVAKPYDVNELKVRLRSARRILDFQHYLRERALVDPLTALLNRRGLERALLAEGSRAERKGTPLAAIAIDLDHFKRVNDEHGHDVGDCVLRETAARIKACVREFDITVRHGGEEFLVLCPETDLAAATAIAERIRATIHGEAYRIPDGVLHVTASFGVAACSTEQLDAATLLQSADAALYDAKRSGRNRVVQASFHRRSSGEKNDDPGLSSRSAVLSDLE